VTAPDGGAGAQAVKGDCYLGTGHWRQVPTDKPFGGWTVGIACSSIAADPVPVAEDKDDAEAGPEDAPGPEPAVPVVAPAAAKKAAAPAPAGPPAAPTKAGWAAALPDDAPIQPVTVPTAITRGAPAAPETAAAAQPDLKASSITA
jgi:hypothetical protein